MASNLATIGLDVTSKEEFQSLLERLAGEAIERRVTTAGDYAIWRSRTGAEVWFHLAPLDPAVASSSAAEVSRDILGLTPFFEGRSEVTVAVSSVVKRDGDNALEGALQVWVAPDGSGSGAYPMVFDAVDFAAQAGRDLDVPRRAKVCGFAREVRAYASEEAFEAAQDQNISFAPQSFFPVGLIAASAEAGAAPPMPSSHALFTGRVIETQRLGNEATGQQFIWLAVESLEATFDVVAVPQVVTGEIVPGGTVQCACWLFGRFLD